MTCAYIATLILCCAYIIFSNIMVKSFGLIYAPTIFYFPYVTKELRVTHVINILMTIGSSCSYPIPDRHINRQRAKRVCCVFLLDPLIIRQLLCFTGVQHVNYPCKLSLYISFVNIQYFLFLLYKVSQIAIFMDYFYNKQFN